MCHKKSRAAGMSGTEGAREKETRNEVQKFMMDFIDHSMTLASTEIEMGSESKSDLRQLQLKKNHCASISRIDCKEQEWKQDQLGG